MTKNIAPLLYEYTVYVIICYIDTKQ